jgi:hypothetical protein
MVALAITSVYIPKVEKEFSAKFIADIFDKNGIAKVSKIVLNPHKSLNFQAEKYNRAYIEIDYWHDTEAAFSFIKRLRTTNRETRLIYSLDNWWTVEINKFPQKLSTTSERTRLVTVFRDSSFNICDNDNLSTTAVVSSESVNIDYEKTRQLKAILYGYKNADEMDEAERFDGYLHEAMNEIRRYADSYQANNTNLVFADEEVTVSV